MPTPTYVYSSRTDFKSKIELEAIGLPVRFGKADVISKVSTQVTAASRLRSFVVPAVQPKATLLSQGKLRVKSGPVAIIASAEAKVTYFVNAAPIAPPEGFLSLMALGDVRGIKSSPAGLSGQRLQAGDTVPIFFKLEGQKMSNLKAKFLAKQKLAVVGETPITITKQENAIDQTAPALDGATGIETMTGSLLLMATDVPGTLATEIEMNYQFQVSDGVGRTYTIERGMFTLYPGL